MKEVIYLNNSMISISEMIAVIRAGQLLRFKCQLQFYLNEASLDFLIENNVSFI